MILRRVGVSWQTLELEKTSALHHHRPIGLTQGGVPAMLQSFAVMLETVRVFPQEPPRTQTMAAGYLGDAPAHHLKDLRLISAPALRADGAPR